MLFYVIRRFLYMIILLLLVSIVAFILIQLPPGDIISNYMQKLQQWSTSSGVSLAGVMASMRKQYGLDLPIPLQYFIWMKNMLQGNFGRSIMYGKEVTELISERLLLTIVLSLFTLVFTYIVAIPIGIYSATHQYSVGDYTFTVVGFVGLATPNFLLALILMFLFLQYFGLDVGGLFSVEYMQAPWSVGKFIDMMNHMWVAIMVIGTAGTAGLIRIMRGCLLDELKKQYVITARAKGVAERALLFKYPVRAAINPIVSTIGWLLPFIVSGEAIVAIVLNLPTIGPLLIEALLSQDMYLAGSIIMFLCFLTIIGTFISDLLLAWLDPRIRYERGV